MERARSILIVLGAVVLGGVVLSLLEGATT